MMRAGKLLKVIIVLLLLSPVAISGQFHCQNPINEGNINNLCNKIVSDLKTGLSPKNVTSQVVDTVLSSVGIGDKGTFGRTDGCYQVSRIQITLFYETGKKVILDEFIDIGDKKDQPVILVKSCQKGEKDNVKEDYASLSIQIFLEKISPTSLKIKADKAMLASRETTSLKAELICGDCPLAKKTITFSRKGSGRLNPLQQFTDASGVAKTMFYAENPGTTVVTASYENLKAETSIITVCTWDMECNFYHKESHPEYDDVKANYNDRWKSEVRFENVPLSIFIGLEILETINNDPDCNEPEFIERYMEWLKVKKFFEARGTFHDYNFTFYDGGTLFRGTVKGKPTWILGIGMTADDISPAKEEPDDEELKYVMYFSIKRDSVTITYSQKAGLKSPYPLRFEKRIKIPGEKIRAGKAFSIKFEDPPDAYLIDGGEIRFIPKYKNNPEP